VPPGAEQSMDFADILDFWFVEIRPQQWWAADPKFDALIAARFGAVLQSAEHGELYEWRNDPRGRLAEIIVLDQFSRNVHRGTAHAFANDSAALVLAQEAVTGKHDQNLSDVQRAFLYMPYMHSESRVIHVQSERLFSALGLADNYDSALRHKKIIDRFGRYPHRNDILGRASTSEEQAFLQAPGSRF
jgi:uncharacterized protein (DUF924 family)